jgi:hypothetical protein
LSPQASQLWNLRLSIWTSSFVFKFRYFSISGCFTEVNAARQ